MSWTLEKKAELYRLLKKGCDKFEIAESMDVPTYIISRQIRAIGWEDSKAESESPTKSSRVTKADKALDSPVREPYIYSDSDRLGCELEYGVPRGLRSIVNGDFDWD